MRKCLLALSLLLAFTLAACSDDTDAPAAGTEEEKAEVEELTADDVLKKSIEAAQNMESAEVSMEMTQKTEVPNEELSFTTVTSTDAQIMMDPLQMYQNGVITVEANGETQEQEMELYLVDNEMYMYDSTFEQWLKMDASTFPVDQLEQQNPVEQLELMQSFTNDMEMEESDDQYTLKITGNGEELMDFTREAMQEYMDGELMAQLEQEGIDIFESMSIENIYYELAIDKETFETKALNLDMNMSIEAEGETLNLDQSVVSEYTGVNTVDSIEIPEEVKDGAVDLEEELENLEGVEEAPVEE